MNLIHMYTISLDLDILMTYNFVVDVDKLELYPSKRKKEDSV